MICFGRFCHVGEFRRLVMYLKSGIDPSFLCIDRSLRDVLRMFNGYA